MFLRLIGMLFLLAVAGCGRSEVFPRPPTSLGEAVRPPAPPVSAVCGPGWVPGKTATLGKPLARSNDTNVLLPHTAFTLWVEERSETEARYLTQFFDWSGAALGPQLELQQFGHAKGVSWPKVVAARQDDGSIISGWVEQGNLELVGISPSGAMTPVASIPTQATGLVFAQRVDSSVLAIVAVKDGLYVQAIRDGAQLGGLSWLGAGHLSGAIAVQGALVLFWTLPYRGPSTLTRLGPDGVRLAPDRVLPLSVDRLARCEASSEIAVVGFDVPTAGAGARISVGRLTPAGDWALAPVMLATGGVGQPAVLCAADRMPVTWFENTGGTFQYGTGNPGTSDLRYAEVGLHGHLLGQIQTLDPRTDTAVAYPQLAADGTSLIAQWSRHTGKGYESVVMTLPCRPAAH